jgi:hypothetical protein
MRVKRIHTGESGFVERDNRLGNIGTLYPHLLLGSEGLDFLRSAGSNGRGFLVYSFVSLIFMHNALQRGVLQKDFSNLGIVAMSQCCDLSPAPKLLMRSPPPPPYPPPRAPPPKPLSPPYLLYS